MRTIFVYIALLISFLGFSQTPFPQQEIQYSPGGKFDSIFDHYGNKYSLKDIKIDTVSSTNKSVSFPNECNSGYFKLYYEDGSGFEIQGNSVHQQRRAVLCQLFFDLSQFIIPVNPNTSVNIWVRNINNIYPSGTNLPAGAATGLYSIPSNTNSTLGGIIENQIWKTINSGVDAYTNVGASFLNQNQSFGNSSPTYYHGFITFDFTNINWNTDLSVSPSPMQYDLYSVALHEITHALGFASLIGIDGSSKLGSPYYTRYDTHLKAFGTDPLITTNSTCSQSYDYEFNTALSSSVLAPSTVNCNVNNSIFFVGQSVNQPVYLSSSFSNGSSLSHFEDLCHLSNIDNSNGSYPDNQYYVMSDVVGIGSVSMKRYLKVEEKNTLCEIGYNLNNSFGNITNSNLNYIAYPSTNCSNSSVVGVNDGIGTNSEYTFVINSTESYTFNYNDFLNNDYPSQGNNLTFECAESVYGLGTINLISPNSFEYTAINNTNGIDLIRYIPIGPNGDKGNITYIYVYVPDGTCVPSACNNYVSNGDFESSSGCGNLGQSGMSSCWSSFINTADLFTTYANDCNYPSLIIPATYYSNPPLNNWDLSTTNNHFIGIYGVGTTCEGIQNHLKAPLIHNESYILSFRVKTSNISFNGQTDLSILGSTNPSNLSGNTLQSTPSFLTNLVTPQHIDANNEWTYYEIQFTSYSSSPINYLTLINSSYLNNYNQLYNLTYSYLYLDDISIVKQSDQITFTPPTTLCLNQTVDLQTYTNTPGGTFSGTGVNVTTFDPLVAGLGTHEITYTYTDNMNCVTNISAYVTIVNDNLSVSINSSQTSFCEGGSATLTAMGSNITSYLWSTNETTSTISVNPLSSNSYSVTVTNSSGCQATSSQAIIVNPLPSSTITAGGSTTFCQGGSVLLNVNTGIGLTYQWQQNGTNISGATSNSYTATTSSSYTVVVTSNNCSTTSNAVIVTVNPTISPTFTQLPNYCVGQTPASLPNPSNNNIIGSWSPLVISTITSGTTTYTFTPTSNPCASTATMTITVNPTITPTFTQLPNYCVGQIPASLPNPSNNNIIGSWSPIVILTSTPGTTTYTFTPIAGQCASNATMTITINPLFSIVSNMTACNSYTWAINGQTYSTSGTYTYTSGCNLYTLNLTINTDSGTNCCSPAYHIIDSPKNLSTLSALNSVPANSIIEVNSILTIDVNRTYSSIKFRMGPNASIIVNSGKILTLTNCTLFSCSEMWDGIEVLTGGSLILNGATGTRIEDAKDAIKSISNASISIVNAKFNKNKIGLHLRAWNSSFNSVNNSTFDCTGSGSPSSPNGFMKAPFANEKSHYGIYLYKMENVTIGGTNLNSFQNLEVGIYAEACTNLTIQRNNFTNINTTCPVSGACTSATLKGWCIYAYGIENVTIGNSTNNVLGNTFTSSFNGIGLVTTRTFGIHNNSFSNIFTLPVWNGNSLIYTSTANCISISDYSGLGSNNFIQNNSFLDFDRGIFYTNNVSNSLTISQNRISNFNINKSTGVHIKDNPQQSFTIRNNIFNVNTNQTGGRAIIVENVNTSFATGQNLSIRTNTIRNVNRGIWITNYNSPQIIDHNSNLYSIGSGTTGTRAGIYFPATLTGASVGNENAGIHINNCPSATISNNTIERTNYTATAPAPLAANQFNLQFGISVGSSCTGTQVSNNVIKLMGSGIYCFGNTPISLKCNNMVNNATGLWLNGQIGQQGTVNSPQDNKWTIPTGYLGVRRNGNPNITSSPVFFTRSLTGQFMPNINTQMFPNSAINPPNPQPATINAANLCFISAPPPAGLVQIVNEEGEYSYLSDEELKTLDLDLYKTLKISPDFYNESTFEGQRIEEFMDSVNLSNSAKIYEYEEKLSLKDTLEAKELMALFEAYSDVEQTYKSVYEIYNRSWLDEVHSFTAEDSLILNEIAYLSPRVAGNAVYTARVLLGLMIIDTETYAAKSTQIINSNTNSYLKIFPNPSNDYFYYFLPLKEEDKGFVSIIDISGKEIQTWTSDSTTNQGSLDIHNYAKGIYLFELTINGNQKLVQKLIVK